MQLIDTHAHIYQEEFDHDIDELIKRSQNVGIGQIVLPNVDASSLIGLESRQAKYSEIFKIAVGLHPCYVKENYKEELDIIKMAAERLPIVAIGEIGLDYHWDLTFKQQQLEALETQLAWALEKQLPVILHCRESMQDIIQAVRPFALKGLTGIFHCFSGTLEEAKTTIDLGFYIGVGGTFTYKKSEMPQILRHIGLERIVLETDSPYLSPIPHRGKRNEPAFMALVAQKVAGELSIPLEKVAEITTRNAKIVFKYAL
jgi:TatD DNase family protein